MSIIPFQAKGIRRKGTRLYDDFERDREARRDRLAEFVFYERIYLTCEKALLATAKFLRPRKNYQKSA